MAMCESRATRQPGRGREEVKTDVEVVLDPQEQKIIGEDGELRLANVRAHVMPDEDRLSIVVECRVSCRGGF